VHQILVYVRVLTVVQHVLYVRSEIIFGKKKINLLMSIAVCSPTCSNGGTCGSPNTCTCPSTYSGTTCTIRKTRYFVSNND